MANLLFHNNTVSLNDVWYESHLSVLKAVCMEVVNLKKLKNYKKKLLGDKMKIKAKKILINQKEENQDLCFIVMKQDQS